MRYLLLLVWMMGMLMPYKTVAYAQERTVTQTAQDKKVIPDLYNTGAVKPNGGFIDASSGEIPCTVNGEKSVLPGNLYQGVFSINFKYKQKDMNGKYIIENADLTSMDFKMYAMESIKENGHKVSLTFNNCKFKTFAGARNANEDFSVVFNNCSFVSATGSDITFNRCCFGGGIHDRMNLFVNCYVNDCYLYNASSLDAASGEIHVDGIQIFGNSTDHSVKTENIHFDNCRFEMPALTYPNAPKTYVNACIMLQTEYSDGDNMTFENCYLNGGGYSMYAHGVKGTKLSNIVFKNLKFGCAALYGKLYPDKPAGDQVVWNEDTWTDATSIYVGTVQRDQSKNETYMCVSNDTNRKRYFRAYTSNGTHYDYAIDACPEKLAVRNSGKTFEELPFDKLYTIPEYCDWVVVYEMVAKENSTNPDMKQVRFQNWTNQKSVKISDVSASNLEYALTKDGTLKVSGFGDMPTFTSADKIPWYGEKDKIQTVQLQGITSISSGMFADCVNLKEVVLDDQLREIESAAFSGCTNLSRVSLEKAKNLKKIGENAFLNCTKLSSIDFPVSVTTVEKDAFAVDTKAYTEYRTNMDIHYSGDLKSWMNISFANASANPMYVSGGRLYVNNGQLVEKLNPAQMSITKIGNASFAGCKSLKEISLDGLTEIGASAFERTNIHGVMTVPKSVTKIGTYVFQNCPNIEKVIWKSDANVSMGCFQNDTAITELVVSGDVKMLGNWCFGSCSALKTADLPEALTSIRQKAFYQCDALTEVIFHSKACPEMTIADVFVKKSTKEASIVVKIPENATGYRESSVIQKMATHLLCTKVIEADKCITPAKEQRVCLLHDKCTENKETIIKENQGSTTEAPKPVKKPTKKPTKKVTVKATSLKKVANKKKGQLAVTWKKVSGVSGYEIQYSTSKNFKKKAHIKKLKKASTTKVTIKKLKKKKKYYVRVRAYKTVKGKKYVSKWSKKKTIKIVR